MDSTEDWALNKKLADDWWELMSPVIQKQQENEKEPTAATEG
ncbi:hypothetical protein [uncultured Vagococcus sp.]|nr:hypothetical protein [uncultured Vagococcus sp.]